MGQSLTIVKLSVDTMRSTDDPASLQEMIDESSTLAGRALDQVRDLSLLLRPSLLDHLGLEAALRWLVNSQANRVGYRATFTTDHVKPPPPQDVAITCYRIAQEALTNVARHASARNVEVELRAADGYLRLMICDDGVGFDLPTMQARARDGGSMGLLSLEERARLVNGHLAIESAPGKGTMLTLSLPYVCDVSATGDPAASAARVSEFRDPSPALSAD